MDDVQRAFLLRWPHDALDAATEKNVGDAVQRVFTAARAAWPEVRVDGARFGEELAARVADISDAAVAVSRLQTADLYFALACAAGDPAATALFEQQYIPEIRHAVERMGFDASVVDEAVQVARITLLVPEDGSAPRLLEYRATGQLVGWLRVVVSRLAMKAARRAGREVPPTDELVAGDDAKDLEIDYLKRTYGDAFRESFREAMASLPVRDRLLLKQRFALQATVVALGVQHGVNASTITRWVQAARDRVVEATRDGMMRRLQLPSSDAASILRLIQSEMDVSLITEARRRDGDAPP